MLVLDGALYLSGLFTDCTHGSSTVQRRSLSTGAVTASAIDGQGYNVGTTTQASISATNGELYEIWLQSEYAIRDPWIFNSLFITNE
jgi:hypothetical protein